MKLKRPLIWVDDGNFDFDMIAQSKLVVFLEAAKRSAGAVVLIRISWQIRHWNHAFRWNLYALGKDTKGFHAGDDGVHRFTNFVRHEI